ESKETLAYALEESEQLEHRHIGTEHLLLGILRVEKSIAASVLFEKGANIKDIREELRRSVESDNQSIESIELSSTDTLRGMLAQMRNLANSTLFLCDRIETKYNELSSDSSKCSEGNIVEDDNKE